MKYFLLLSIHLLTFLMSSYGLAYTIYDRKPITDTIYCSGYNEGQQLYWNLLKIEIVNDDIKSVQFKSSGLISSLPPEEIVRIVDVMKRNLNLNEQAKGQALFEVSLTQGVLYRLVIKKDSMKIDTQALLMERQNSVVTTTDKNSVTFSSEVVGKLNGSLFHPDSNLNISGSLSLIIPSKDDPESFKEFTFLCSNKKYEEF